MSPRVSLFVVLLLACDFKTSSAFSCACRIVGDARSQVTNTCLRLSICSCDCSPTGSGCPGQYYRVDPLSDNTCSAVLTWCSWAPWQEQIQTSQTSQTGCEKVSTRQRVCCIAEDGTVTPTHSNLESWTCPTDIAGDKQTIQTSVSCPTRSNNLSVVFISLIVCLFFVTVVIVIVRIFFYKKINAYFHRNSATSIAPNNNQRQSHNPYIQESQTAPPYPSDNTSPPTYTEAINQMPKLPSYDEILHDSNIIENAPPHAQTESAASPTTCPAQSNNNDVTSDDNSNNDNPSSSRNEDALQSDRRQDTTC